MAYNTKAIKLDVNSKPVPQYYNANVDDYEVLQGQNGAARALLYGPDGNPINATGGRLAVQASELDITLSALRDALRGVDSKTLSDLATLLTAIRDTAGVKRITDPVDVSDRAARLLGKISADDGAIAALGALAAAAVTDPATSASVISLLKGLLKQLQGAGTGSMPVTLNGSNTSTETLGSDVTIAAGAYRAYDNLDVRRAAYIIPSFRETAGAAHANKLTLNWRAIYGQVSTATIAEDAVASGTRAGGGALAPVKGEAVQLVLSNQDTVSHTYNIWITRRAV